MNIIIPIKQVPETNNVKMDEETGTMIRSGVESIINPLDLYAIETGLELKEKVGGEITVISMGPSSAEKALREALAMGCDHGILLTGKEFAGSDTWATSYALSQTIKDQTNYDLILTGERATDGDTGQVGPGIASFLDIPLSSYTSEIVSVDENKITVKRLIEEGYETLEMTLPSLLTVVKEISYPRLPTLSGKQRARKAKLKTFSANEVEMEKEKLGLSGSPTRVVSIDHPKVTRDGEFIKVKDEDSLEEAVRRLNQFLRVKSFI